MESFAECTDTQTNTNTVRKNDRKKQQAGILLTAAYYVHGAIAPCLPYAIPLEQKQKIKRAITNVDAALCEAFLGASQDKLK